MKSHTHRRGLVVATMEPLRNHLGAELKDQQGHVIKKGNTIRDDMFGDGIARGTVPLQLGDGVNVVIYLQTYV